MVMTNVTGNCRLRKNICHWHQCQAGLKHLYIKATCLLKTHIAGRNYRLKTHIAGRNYSETCLERPLVSETPCLEGPYPGRMSHISMQRLLSPKTIVLCLLDCLRDHSFMTNGAIFQNRFYCSIFSISLNLYIKTVCV